MVSIKKFLLPPRAKFLRQNACARGDYQPMLFKFPFAPIVFIVSRSRLKLINSGFIHRDSTHRRQLFINAAYRTGIIEIDEIYRQCTRRIKVRGVVK
jgi:hypothetical protein